jgi:hypothetical protein
MAFTETIELKSLTKSNNNGLYGGNNIFNVVTDYPWCLSNIKDLSKYIPYIELIEFEQDVAAMYASLQHWYLQAKQAINKGENPESNNPYKGMYSGIPTDTKFILPYFENYDHNLSQNWVPSKGILEMPIADMLTKGIEGLAKVFMAAPGANINKPRIWDGSSPQSYSINFHLFNTNTVNKEQIKKNQAFKRRLLMSTLHDQRNAILISPPALFIVKIPGIRYSPAAVISNLVVENVGQMNLIDGENIPDAYKFSITITELITESRQILDASTKGTFEKVMAIESVNISEEQAKKEQAQVQGEGQQT